MMERVFSDYIIEMAKDITLWQKFKLLFKSKQYYTEGKAKVVYKVINNQVFVLDIYYIPQ